MGLISVTQSGSFAFVHQPVLMQLVHKDCLHYPQQQVWMRTAAMNIPVCLTLRDGFQQNSFPRLQISLQFSTFPTAWFAVDRDHHPAHQRPRYATAAPATVF